MADTISKIIPSLGNLILISSESIAIRPEDDLKRIFSYNHYNIDQRFTDPTIDKVDTSTPPNELWMYSPNIDATFKEVVHSLNVNRNHLYYHRTQIAGICDHHKGRLRTWGSNIFMIRISEQEYAFMEVVRHRKGLEIIYRNYDYDLPRTAHTKPTYFFPCLLQGD